MAIASDEIKAIVFSDGNYNKYLSIAKEQCKNIKKMGIQPDELVNEAIIAIFDTRLKFETEEDVFKFIAMGIKGVAYSEYQDSKQKGNGMSVENEEYVQSGNTENVFEYGDSVYAAKSENLYDLFHGIRFTSGVECPSCGCKKTTAHNFGQQCIICLTAYSVTSRTYLNRSNLSFSKMYAVAEHVLNGKDLTPSRIRSIFSLNKAPKEYIKKIIKISTQIDSKDVLTVLTKGLSPVAFEENKLDIKIHCPTQLKASEVNEMRKLFIDGASVLDLMKKYNKSKSSITEILSSNGRGGKLFVSADVKLKEAASEKYNNKFRKGKTQPCKILPKAGGVPKISAMLTKISILESNFYAFQTINNQSVTHKAKLIN